MRLSKMRLDTSNTQFEKRKSQSKTKNIKRRERITKEKSLKNFFKVNQILILRKSVLLEHFLVIFKNYYMLIKLQLLISKRKYPKRKKSKRELMNYKLKSSLAKFRFLKELMILLWQLEAKVKERTKRRKVSRRKKKSKKKLKILKKSTLTFKCLEILLT